jgi:beta-glucosidase
MIVFVIVLLLLVTGPILRAENVPYKDPKQPVETRIEDLLGRLTLDEKIEMLSGRFPMSLHGNERLGIPAFTMGDACMGIHNYGKTTAYANGIALAATWDVQLAERVGESLGRDCRARGVNFLLAPGMNLYRAPMCGRNFEYLGEDPYLAGDIASHLIRGVQSQQVAVTAKHFVANEQEVDRHDLSSTVDERTLRELYLKPFEMVIKTGAWGVMSSYNPLNGIHTSQNDWLLNKILKGEWGFGGIVMSDWISCYDTQGIFNGGLDLEMPEGKFFNKEKLLPLIQSGKVQQATLDDKIRRQLRVAFSLGWFDRPQQDPSIPKDDPASDALALQGARESVTLLKNEHLLLPLDLTKVKKIVLLGHNADPAVYGGGGSALVDPFHKVSVYQGIRKLVGPKVKVILVPWKRSMSTAASPPPVAKPHPEALEANGAEGTPPIPSEFIAEVKSADVVIVCAGFSQAQVQKEADPKQFDEEGEGADRSYALPPGQPEVIKAVAALNPRNIVILNAGGSVATKDWIGSVPVFLDAYYPGQNGGTAIAEILFGKTNPSGRLPFSWEKRWEDCAAFGHYPTYEEGKLRRNDYQEGVFLGYRWFDSKKIEPLFPFGFGLNYTTFSYSDLKIVPGKDDTLKVEVTIRNTGTVSGAEIVQLYIQPPKTDVPRPVRELRGFTRVELAPHEGRRVALSLHRRDLAYWDPASKHWKVTPGNYVFAVGSSSAKLLLHEDLIVSDSKFD